MDLIREISNSETFQILFKLLLSSVLAGFIGIERSALSKPAGFGTHAIIGLSSALIVMGSQYMATYYDIDAARIPAQSMQSFMPMKVVAFEAPDINTAYVSTT